MTNTDAKHLSGHTLQATVGTVRGDAGNRFAVAYLAQDHPVISRDESITFSISDWKDTTEPRKGQVVVLDGVKKFARGWRATIAYPIGAEEQEAERKDHS